MGKPSHFQHPRPSHLSAQEQMRKRQQSHPTIQPKIAISPQQAKQPAAPPVYRPQQAPRVLQTKIETAHPGRQAPAFRGAIQQTPAGVIQRVTCDKCGKSGHTKAKCYLYGNTKANPNSGARQESKAQRAFNSFSGYRSDFFSDNDVSVGHVTQFLAEGNELHGHGSGGSGDGENYATKGDADTFVGWWRKKYG